jgi:phytoene synthase
MRASANRALKALPAAAFPAVAHAALIGVTSEGVKRLRLFWATLTGGV